MAKTKPFCIPKQSIWRAYKQVKVNRGAAGIDEQTIIQFEEDLENNLYQLWNRMSSGSYFPPPVKRVDIPKSDGRTRALGIPTVSDRIAQTVIRNYLEPILEPVFHEDSYGYRPSRSAHQALQVARQRCWRNDWVLDLDVKSFFDEIDWKLMMRALRSHTDCNWVLLYIERWLKVQVSLPDGTLLNRYRGTPQGGVISPLLANLFLHYTFDVWMDKYYPNIAFERYADDIICHCRSETQARSLWEELDNRFEQCKLQLHPEKTKIVYCKDTNRTGKYPIYKFDFLGYTFRPRRSKNRKGELFVSFSPAVSDKAAKRMRRQIRRWRIHRRNDLSLQEIARWAQPILSGWVRYYGRFHPSALRKALRTVDKYIVRWAQRKYKRYRRKYMQVWEWLRQLKADQPRLFAHWS